MLFNWGKSETCEITKSSPPWMKWQPFHKRYLQMHFRECNVLYFDWNFIEAFSLGSNWQYLSIGWDYSAPSHWEEPALERAGSENVQSWWRHQMETYSALLAICAGNSPATGEFPAQRPVTRSFDVFFVLRLFKRLNKQSRGWWFEKPSRPLWRHSTVMQWPKWQFNIWETEATVFYQSEMK